MPAVENVCVEECSRKQHRQYARQKPTAQHVEARRAPAYAASRCAVQSRVEHIEAREYSAPTTGAGNQEVALACMAVAGEPGASKTRAECKVRDEALVSCGV